MHEFDLQAGQSVVILGAAGLLGQALAREFPEALAWDKVELDITDFEQVRHKLFSLEPKPEVIFNCAAYNDVDGAEKNPRIARLLNSEALGNLAHNSRALGSTLVHFSTNFVFDGKKGEYSESDSPSPVSVYAESKALGEAQVLNQAGKFYLVRSALLFGPPGASENSKKTFVDLMLELSQKTDTIKAVNDEVYSLTYANDLAAALKRLLTQNLPYGIYHLVNSGSASWYDYAKEIFGITGKKINLIPVSSAEFPRPARRPKKSVLLSTKFPPLRPWQEALAEYLRTDYKS